MVSSRVVKAQGVGPLRGAAFGALIAVPLAMAGCSADVSRFDSPFFGMSDSGSSAPPRPAAGLGGSKPLAEQSPDTGTSNGGAYFPPQTGTRNAGSMKVTSLPDTAAPATVAPITKTRPAAAAVPAAAAGQTIEVQPGDTVYGLSRRYGVSVAELTTLNGLQNPTIRVGQKLMLPASANAGVPRAPVVAAAAPAIATAPATAPGSPPVADAAGNYTVRAGDQIGSIAKANRTSTAALLAANGMTDPKQLRAGVTIRMPDAAGTVPAVPVVAAAAPAVPVATEPAVPAVGGPKINIVNGAKTRVASAAGGAVGVTAPATAKSADVQAASAGGAAVAASPKFRWPVQGRVQAGFGPRSDGSNNDGLDIIVPLGTEVLAAEAGEVVYTGDGIPSFGNLVLLRHANGYVTAYAHNDQLLVKRGDKVRRGQAVAKAGKSGQVDQPMLHFEVRQGQTPVDPMPFMEKL